MALHSAQAIIGKLRSAFGLIRDGRYGDLVAKISDNYQRHLSFSQPQVRALAGIPVVLMEQLHLLIDERALAYPRRDGNWRVVHLPTFEKGRLIPVLQRSVMETRHGSPRHKNVIDDIYSYEGFVEIEQNDTVVDVGAFIGTLAFCVGNRASTLVSIDPIAATNDILRYNTREYSNVVVVPKAAWKEPGKISIRQSAIPNENSVFSPDKQETGKSVEVSADTVPNIARELGLEKIDFLKVEAEGAEPEILEGALSGGMPINKVAVDASEERNGEDTVQEIGSIFDNYGYEWRVQRDAQEWGNYIVFAKREL